VFLLEAEAKACETQRYPPSLDREQSLVERANNFRELGILGLKVIVEAIEIGLWQPFRWRGLSHDRKISTIARTRKSSAAGAQATSRRPATHANARARLTQDHAYQASSDAWDV
jgi:hypothetical protein